MKFYNNKKNPKAGDKRVVTKFALKPITIGIETRWLETVTVKQRYEADGCSGGSFFGWVDIQFIDKNK